MRLQRRCGVCSATLSELLFQAVACGAARCLTGILYIIMVYIMSSLGSESERREKVIYYHGVYYPCLAIIMGGGGYAFRCIEICDLRRSGFKEIGIYELRRSGLRGIEM